MPITPIHVSFNLITYYIISLLSPIEFLPLNCLFLSFAEIIDIDHLFSKPIYHPKRNPFKTHYLHRNWKLIIILALFSLPFYPIIFFGIGLISHIFLDYIYTKYWINLN